MHRTEQDIDTTYKKEHTVKSLMYLNIVNQFEKPLRNKQYVIVYRKQKGYSLHQCTIQLHCAQQKNQVVHHLMKTRHLVEDL